MSERPGDAGMEEKIDASASAIDFSSANWIGLMRYRASSEREAQQRLQPRDDARAPGLGCLERDQALFEFFRRSSYGDSRHPRRSAGPEYTIHDVGASPSGWYPSRLKAVRCSRGGGRIHAR